MTLFTLVVVGVIIAGKHLVCRLASGVWLLVLLLLLRRPYYVPHCPTWCYYCTRRLGPTVKLQYEIPFDIIF